MTDRGLVQADPLEPHLENVSQEQARVLAVADVDCKVTSRLVDVWRQQDVEAQERLALQHAPRLSAERKALDEALARAAVVK